tara:strand:+ start:3858 stop:4229 length:372 start_codon:yes stop_codon:yes gene_type:complete
MLLQVWGYRAVLNPANGKRFGGRFAWLIDKLIWILSLFGLRLAPRVTAEIFPLIGFKVSTIQMRCLQQQMLGSVLGGTVENLPHAVMSTSLAKALLEEARIATDAFATISHAVGSVSFTVHLE